MFLYKNTIFYYDKRNITYQYNYQLQSPLIIKVNKYNQNIICSFNNVELGKAVSNYVLSGKFVPDDIMISMINEEIKAVGKQNWLLDGKQDMKVKIFVLFIQIMNVRDNHTCTTKLE